MQQFLHVIGKGIVGGINPLKGQGTQLVIFINELDNHGNFLRQEKAYVNLFNAAQKLALNRSVKVGDTVFLCNAKLTSFQTPDGRHCTSIVCNYANQIDIVSFENHNILDSRAIGEYA